MDSWIEEQQKFSFGKEIASQNSNPHNFPPQVKQRNI